MLHGQAYLEGKFMNNEVEQRVKDIQERLNHMMRYL